MLMRALATAVCLAYLGFAALNYEFAFSFLSKTSWSSSAPKGSAADLATIEFSDHFYQKLAVQMPLNFAILLSSEESHAAFTNQTFVLTEQFLMNATVGSCATKSLNDICYWRRLESVTTSSDGRHRLLLFNVNGGFHPNTGTHGMYSEWDRLATHIAAAAPDKSTVTVSLCHESMLLRAAKIETIKDFEVGDGLTLPLAWVVLMAVVGLPGLLVLLTLPMSLLLSFCINAHLASKYYGYHFASFSPSIFISMLVALNNVRPNNSSCSCHWRHYQRRFKLIALGHF